MHGGCEEARGGPGDEPDAVPARPATPPPVSEVLAALKQIQDLSDFVMAAPLWQHRNDDAIDAVRQSAIAIRKVQAAHLTAIADMHSRAGTLPNGLAGYETRTLLRHGLHRTMGQAKADLAAAAALAPGADPATGGMPRLGAAFAAGQTSRDTSTPPSASWPACPRTCWPRP